MRYTLTVTRPDGRILERYCDTAQQARNEVKWMLNNDEFRVPLTEAAAFAKDLTDVPHGTTITHGQTGVSFRIDPTTEAST